MASSLGFVFNRVVQQLNAKERLEVLRRMDGHRRWYSVRDRRICAVCEKAFDGLQIEITGEPGNPVLHCPTKDCPSDISHWWFLHQLGDAKAAARPPLGGLSSRAAAPISRA
jgi:hypothetical protein